MANKNKIFYIILLLLFSVSILFSKTREDIISEAENYANLEWTVRKDNILDVVKYYCDENGKMKSTNGSDGIDDRMGKINDLNKNKKLDLIQFNEDGSVKSWGDITSENLKNWPYYVGRKVQGMAYAYGGSGVHGNWGADKRNIFTDKILGLGNYKNQKWIAGRKASEKDNPKDPPKSYWGYAGIECSGFMSRIYGFIPIIYTEGIPSYSLRINMKNIQQGDVLFYPRQIIDGQVHPGHVVIFKGWKDAEHIYSSFRLIFV